MFSKDQSLFSTTVGRLAVAGVISATALVAIAPVAATAAAGPADVSLTVLVLDDGSAMVAAITDRLSKEGVATKVVSLTAAGRPEINAGFLATSDATGNHGNFSGVVVPSDSPTQLSAAELSALSSYEANYGAREVSAYNWANPTVGLNYAANPGYIGTVDGMAASVTSAGRAGAFKYLRGSLALDDIAPQISESYGYLATPLTTDPNGGTFTPLVTARIPGTTSQGSLIGQYDQGGRQRLIMTFASNASQQHWRVLSHGIVNWLTRGISTSMNRNYLAVNIDDVLLSDAKWSIPGKCTIGDGCDETTYPSNAPGATVRMQSSDVTRLLNWQTANGVKLDMTYNGGGSAQYLASNNTTTDPLLTGLKTNASSLRWLNHTWSHPFLGCVQTSNTPPWSCTTDAAGNVNWVPKATVDSEIAKNITFASTNGLPLTPSELVTGEHSGLKSLPQQLVDNPNLVSSLSTQRVKWIASDASRELQTRPVGVAQTVPRYPLNIFYNVSTKQEETAEYNWIYTSVANGGSGLCEQNPATSTCITPLDLNTGFDSYIRPFEARQAFARVADNDPRPHYAHQSNLADDGLLYPVIGDVVNRYRSTFAPTAPLLNPSLAQSGDTLVKQQKWSTDVSAVSARIVGGQLVLKNTSTRSISAPVTVPGGTINGVTFGEAYAGERSGFVQLAPGQQTTIALSTASGYTSPGTAAAAAATPAPAPAPMQANTPNTTVIEQPTAKTAVIEAAVAAN